MEELRRSLTDLCDKRLVERGNKLSMDLFRSGVHSIRQCCRTDSESRGAYRFLSNDRVSETDLVRNLRSNCAAASRGRTVICIQDTTEINLSSHRGRIKADGGIGRTQGEGEKAQWGFFLHPCLVVDASQGIPYGYSSVDLWHRPFDQQTKHGRGYKKLAIEEKESYKWIRSSLETKGALGDVVDRMVIVQDREGDIYEQFCQVPDDSTDLLVRSSMDRLALGRGRLSDVLSDSASLSGYQVQVDSSNKRSRRVATVEIRYARVEVNRPRTADASLPQSLSLYAVEAREVGYSGEDAIHWRLLTTIPADNDDLAMACIEWYSWRWMLEEVFKILKKEGFDVEASELESAKSIRKLCLLIMEVTIKLFLMRLAYEQPELPMDAGTCFCTEEQECLEHQIPRLEGRTDKQKNPYGEKDLKRYVWAIARMGGWKGYVSERKPGITTLWIGIRKFKMLMEGWSLYRDVYTR